MTYREKLKQEHPEWIDPVFPFGGCYACPADYGYEDADFDDRASLCIAGSCEECWNREYPAIVSE